MTEVHLPYPLSLLTLLLSWRELRPVIFTTQRGNYTKSALLQSSICDQVLIAQTRLRTLNMVSIIFLIDLNTLQ